MIMTGIRIRDLSEGRFLGFDLSEVLPSHCQLPRNAPQGSNESKWTLIGNLLNQVAGKRILKTESVTTKIQTKI